MGRVGRNYGAARGKAADSGGWQAGIAKAKSLRWSRFCRGRNAESVDWRESGPSDHNRSCHLSAGASDPGRFADRLVVDSFPGVSVVHAYQPPGGAFEFHALLRTTPEDDGGTTAALLVVETTGCNWKHDCYLRRNFVFSLFHFVGAARTTVLKSAGLAKTSAQSARDT